MNDKLTPFFIQQLDATKQTDEKLKLKQQFFYVAWQDGSGRIIDIKHYNDYDTALLKGMENAKVTGTTWTIRDLSGRFVDGNYESK
jgi:hypothetical protein